MPKLDAYPFSQTLNFQTLIQEYVAEGITDSRVMLERINTFVTERNAEHRRLEIRDLGKQERLSNKKARTKARIARAATVRIAKTCQECGGKLLPTSCGSPVVECACGYSEYAGI